MKHSPYWDLTQDLFGELHRLDTALAISQMALELVGQDHAQRVLGYMLARINEHNHRALRIEKRLRAMALSEALPEAI